MVGMSKRLEEVKAAGRHTFGAYTENSKGDVTAKWKSIVSRPRMSRDELIKLAAEHYSLTLVPSDTAKGKGKGK
jgi:hypothetical protein